MMMNHRHIPFAVCCLFLVAGAAPGKTIYVNVAAPGPVYDGASWATAFPTLSQAVGAALGGDEVWMARGIYTTPVTISKNISLYGGFDGTDADRSQARPAQNRTALMVRADTAITVQSTATSCRLDGLTITGATYGLTLAASGLSVTRCVISGNSMGVRATSCSPTIADCVFTGNGRGIYLNTASPVLRNNTFLANENGLYLYSGSCQPLVVNNLFLDNGISLYRASATGTVTFRNNDFYGYREWNALGIPNPTGMYGNIGRDPRIVSAEWGNVHLLPSSPCRNAGDPTVVTPDETDMDGQPRLGAGSVDIGADQSDGTDWTGWAPSPAVMRVAPTGNDTADGATWATAKRTIQAALDAVAYAGGGEVWAAAGGYPDRVTVHPYVSLYGGFAGTETQRNGRRPADNPTHITNAPSWYSYALTGSVEFYTGLAACRLDGVRVEVSNLGIGCDYGAAPIITGCMVTGASPYGIFLDGASNSPTAAITNTLFSKCQEAVLCAYVVPSTFGNNTLVGNAMGLHLRGYSPDRATVANCLFASNGQGILVDYSAKAPLVHACDFNGNTTANATGFPDPTGASGNIGADPLFVNAASGDYHLQSGSPCADAGDDASATGEVDLDGNPRIQGRHVDIGAYESPYLTTSYHWLDLLNALRTAGGLKAATSDDAAFLNASKQDASSATVDLGDALAIARKLAGVEPNP